MSDLEIRIFPPRPLECQVEARLDGSARFVGAATFDAAAFVALENDALAYGRLLRDALFSTPAIQRAYLKASANKPVRLRLLIDAPEVSLLRWERMLDLDGEDLPAAASPHTPFSRFVEGTEVPTESTNVPSILLAIANPSNLDPGRLIDVNAEIDNLLDAWEPLLEDGTIRPTIMAGRTELSKELRERLEKLGPSCTIVDGPTTLNALTRELASVEGLHLIAHGNIVDGKAVLVLEDNIGASSRGEEDALRVALQQPRLRFAFLHSCRGARGGTVGLGPSLVGFGVPAVIAMQDFVPMGDARRFAAAFYAALIREGTVDAAANAGRQAILRSNSQNWAIPVLFTHLKHAQVWKPDPIRSAVKTLAKKYQAEPNVRQPFALDGVLVRGSLAGLPVDLDGLSGPRLSLMEGSEQLLGETPKPFVVLLGDRGRAKSAHLQRLFVRAADRYGDERARTPLTLFLSDCIRDVGSIATTIARAVATAFRRHEIEPDGLDSAMIEEALDRRAFLLLVAGDDELSGADRADAIDTLNKFQTASAQNHQIFVVDDLSSFDGETYPERAAAQIVQPMSPDRVRDYLGATCSADIFHALMHELQDTGLFDLAGVPWLLARLVDNARQGGRITSRAQVFERFAREGLARLDNAGGGRMRAGQALCRMAWHMQLGRQVSLHSADVYAILAEIRGNRDFPLEQFRGDATTSHLLIPSGHDRFRFAYRGLQWYFAARYLAGMGARERHECLEDITATLGRLSRVRWWEHTLVMLAGLGDDPDGLLRKILAGSGFTEGEQILVAARCLHEARRAGRGGDAVGRDIVDQIVDTLVWRSRPSNVRSISARRSAIQALGLLRETRVIPHLVAVAIRQVRKDWEGKPTFDYSGVRQAAVGALLAMREATLQYVREHPQLSKDTEIQRLIDAWWDLDVEALGALLNTDHAAAAVAAFALGTINTDQCFDILVTRYRALLAEPRDADMLWAITDTLAAFDPLKVTKQAILPLLDQPLFASYLAYLIGKLGVAGPDGEETEFLRRSLHSDDRVLQGRALRSYAALLAAHGTATSAEGDALRELCHALAQGDFGKAEGSPLIRITSRPSPWECRALQYQALEALRAIGNERSIDILRDMRRGDDDWAEPREATGVDLNRLSFEIAEEIYWRLTGGLVAETFASPDQKRIHAR